MNPVAEVKRNSIATSESGRVNGGQIQDTNSPKSGSVILNDGIEETPYPLQKKPVSTFGLLPLTTVSRIWLCSPCYQPWALTWPPHIFSGRHPRRKHLQPPYRVAESFQVAAQKAIREGAGK
jgi:hypothetical protein